MAEKRVSVRIGATGGRQVRAEFRGIGQDGRRSFALVGREVDNLNRRMGRLGRGAGGARNAMRNVGLQLNQVAQQGAVTGDYLRALSIQMPDLLLGFGGLGIAIGTVAAVLGPFIVDLLSANDTSEKLSETVKGLDVAVSAYASSVKAAAAPTSELVKKYGALAGEARALLVVQRDLAKLEALDSIAEGMKAANDALAAVTGKSTETLIRQADAIEKLKSKLQDALKAYLDFNERGIGAGIPGRALQVSNDLIAAQQALDAAQRAQKLLAATAQKAGMTEAALRGVTDAMADLRDARGIEEQAVALEKLRETYTAALGGVENMTAEQRTLLKQLTDAALATVRFRATMDDAEISVGATAAQATVLADELARAAGNAMSLVQQGLSSLRESEIRLKFKDDPVGLARALAGARFDARVGDISGADPILQEGLRRQREAYMANAEAVARNQQALAKWNRAQRQAAAGVKTLRTEVQKQATGLAAAKETLTSYAEKALDLGKGLGDTFVGAFQRAEQAIGDFVRTGKLDFRSFVQSILADMAQLWARRFILGPLANALSGALGGMFGGGGLLASILHSGGVVGAGGPTRAVPALAFAGAPRMHSGGWAGLRPDEVPAILQRGERVLSRREVAAGLQPGGKVDVRVYVDHDGNWRAAVERISGRVSARIAGGMVSDYDRAVLPGRLATINPRRAG